MMMFMTGKLKAKGDLGLAANIATCSTCRRPEAWPCSPSTLSEEQRELRDWVHGFAAEVVRPAAAEWDEREETPWPVIQEAAKIGLYGFEFLANCWADPTGLSLCLANEELFWGDAGIGLAIMGTSLAVAAIYGSGTPEQLVEWVPQCFGDPSDPKVAAFCSTEPEAGSDVGAMRTRARYDEATDEWVLTGQKAYATNGGIANVHVVTASVDPSLGSRGPGRLRRPTRHRGPDAGPKLRKLGLRASHTADVFLDDVRVSGLLPARRPGGARPRLDRGPHRAALSRPGGHADLRAHPTDGRWGRRRSVARAAYEYALDYAKYEVQFGRPIIENQAIAFALTDMRIEIDAARLLVWRAAWMGRNNRPSRPARVDVQAQGRRGRGRRHREGGADPRRRRLRA